VSAGAVGRWTLSLALLGLASCHALQRPKPVPPAPVPAAAPAQQHYHIDAARSQVLILVYRDGPMARLGHNHVLSVQGLSGDVAVEPPSSGSADAFDPSSASFWLEFPVAAMTIDDPALRAAAGDDFKTTVDAAAVEGTRSHMLGDQLLDAAHYATIRLQSERLRTDGDRWIASVRIRVRDHDGVAEVPVALERSAEQLTLTGEFDLTHAQLGLTPYSVALGALRVAEGMHIRYRLVAQR